MTVGSSDRGDSGDSHDSSDNDMMIIVTSDNRTVVIVLAIVKILAVYSLLTCWCLQHELHNFNYNIFSHKEKVRLLIMSHKFRVGSRDPSRKFITDQTEYDHTFS